MENTGAEPGSDLRWWKYESDALASNISSTIQQMYTTQSYRREADWRHARMYGNYVGYGAGGSPLARTGMFGSASRLSLNVVKNICTAVTAEVTSDKPKVMFLTSGGDYTEQKKAKQLTKFTEGQFYESNLYSLAPTIFLDACIYGTGMMKVYTEEGSIKCERVFPWEVLVDEADGRDMAPRQVYQSKKMDKLVLCELYPEHEKSIMNAPITQSFDYEAGDTSLTGYLSNLIQVREAWHLPSGKKAKDGKHVITIEGCVLLDEEYTRDYFPFVTIRWSKAPVGYWGIGIAEGLTGLQIEINSVLRSIQQSIHMIGKGQWLVENSSRVLSTYLDNDIGTITKFSGIAPQFYAPQIMAPEVYSYLWALYAKAYEIEGVSQLSAQSQKPSGLDSGKALRTYNDIQTKRFIVVAREYEGFFLEAARQMIDLGRELSEEDPSYSVKVDGPRSFERIKWKDVNLSADEYVLKAYPINAFSDDPAEKMQQVQEYVQAGMIDQEEGLRLLDFPDIEQTFNRRFASHNLIEDLIENMIDKGQYEAPEPFIDLDDAIKTTQMAYVQGKLNKVPQDNLDLLLRFMSDAIALKTPPASAMPQPPMPTDLPPGSINQVGPQAGPPGPGGNVLPPPEMMPA